MEVFENTEAHLVWDGGNEIQVPLRCGKPRGDQLLGSVGDQLSEISGRICYDSLGSGRGSYDYHKHIFEVGHHSINEHYNITIGMKLKDLDRGLFDLFNRPGVFIQNIDSLQCSLQYPMCILSYADSEIRITYNPRVVIDWLKMTTSSMLSPFNTKVYKSMQYWIQKTCPIIFASSDLQKIPDSDNFAELLTPHFEEEKWVSLYIVCSRGISHELVRHGDFTAFSQRSTRYVDESQSDYVEHPLYRHILDSHAVDINNNTLSGHMKLNILDSKQLYKRVVEEGIKYLINKGVSKFSARKQARGAARQFLGNGLKTELIMSASVAQWKRILQLRLHEAAEAEIRELSHKMLETLRKSRYGKTFDIFKEVDSPDGIGKVLATQNV